MKIHNLTLYCNCVEESAKFYNEIFKFNIIKEAQPVPDVRLILIEREGMRIELLERIGAPKVIFNDFTTTLVFSSDELDEDFRMMQKKDIKIKSELIDIGPKTKLFEIYDPSGYPICIEQEK